MALMMSFKVSLKKALTLYVPTKFFMFSIYLINKGKSSHNMIAPYAIYNYAFVLNELFSLSFKPNYVWPWNCLKIFFFHWEIQKNGSSCILIIIIINGGKNSIPIFTRSSSSTRNQYNNINIDEQTHFKCARVPLQVKRKWFYFIQLLTCYVVCGA